MGVRYESTKLSAQLAMTVGHCWPPELLTQATISCTTLRRCSKALAKTKHLKICHRADRAEYFEVRPSYSGSMAMVSRLQDAPGFVWTGNHPEGPKHETRNHTKRQLGDVLLRSDYHISVSLIQLCTKDGIIRINLSKS